MLITLEDAAMKLIAVLSLLLSVAWPRAAVSATDSPRTLESPTRIATSDGRHYVLYGAPAGQNNKSPRKIIFSLPGHGVMAEADYSAWKSQLLANGTYALASINWWDGGGEEKSHYLDPAQVLAVIREFLASQNYRDSDVVLLEGFSRGSANTYGVVANDRFSHTPVIDGVISASGKYQADFPIGDGVTITSTLFANVPWILACGRQDSSPGRDGCEGMEETRTFLQSHGARVLAVLADPDGGHGAFHLSPLKLAEQALGLMDKTLVP